jgi:hypothetical protein
MRIKEFFKNCTCCYHVCIFVRRKDESGEYQYDVQGIYYLKDFNEFINGYGDEEMVEWSVGNNKGTTEITFYLK